MSFLLERDALNGKSGKAILTREGRNHELFGAKKIQADAEFQESDFKVIGTTLVQKKTTGVTQTGTMTIYYGTPYFLEMLQEYRKTGRLPYFSMQIVNDDPSTSVGSQIVVLYNCKLSKVPIAMLDADAEWLEEEVSFSFTDVAVMTRSSWAADRKRPFTCDSDSCDRFSNRVIRLEILDIYARARRVRVPARIRA